MTTHADLIVLLRTSANPWYSNTCERAANALEAQDTTITALRAEVTALREVAKAAKVVASHRQTTFDEWERLRDALKGIGAAIDAKSDPL